MAAGLKIDQDDGGKMVDDTHYKQIVGSLMYLTNTRSDIMHATCLYMQAVKRILRYLKGSMQLGILYQRSKIKGELLADSDYVEAEYVVATACACQLLWMRRVLKSLKHEEKDCIEIKCDNSSTIKLSKNPVMYGHCKHIDVRYHFLRDMVKRGTIALSYCRSEDQVADVMTIH
ncbi:hypothetical protein LIER_03822 [Lithospermum erythrorhizon]|uniref:Retrovirus-related Pol polyprotein from transposon TNT 1-94 n=1 Tax=Lithospermum erythrorhizon TaxID=34254 RepID=A0AAV3NW84_LITER